MADSISLSAGMRNNLLTLQQTAASLQNTQSKLATGNKINSALDGPTSFFAAKSLNQRAGDLDGLKDGIGQAISTLKAADQGITQIQSLLDQAKGLTTQALGSLGTDANSVQLRNNLANQYNNVLRQIDKLAQDSGYAGKNLLVGSGLRIDATSDSKTSVNSIIGVSGATASNVTKADTYTIAITGDGAISGNSKDISDAEQLRGISNLNITGFDSTTTGNFSNISIKLSGGTGKDKTFTITEGDQSTTLTFTQAQWSQANSNGQVLHASVAFNSGTKVGFDINFKDIENVPDTAGVGTSVIEKNVNLQVKATNSAGETIVRDGLNALGQGKASNGENAFAFDSGTARVTVDQRQVLQGSTYTQSISSSYGTGSGAIVGSPTTASAVTSDTTYSVKAAASNFNYSTNTFDKFSTQLGDNHGNAGTATTVSAGNASSVKLTTGTGNTTDFTVGLNLNALGRVATAAAANAAEVQGTLVKGTATGGFGGTSAAVAVNGGAGATDATGFAKNTVTNVNYTIKATGANTATVTFDDGQGGTATVNYNPATGGAVSATISGGANNGAHVQLTLGSATVASGDSTSGSFKVRGAFDGTDATGKAVSASFDVRAAHTGQTAKLQTKQLVDGTDANNMAVQLNETNTSNVTVVSQNVQTDGQGLKLDFAQNGWNDRADIENAQKQLDAAKLTLRSASSNLSTNLNVIQTRETYTAAFSNVLKEGAGKLTLADQNEEGANMLTLQTRQQLGTISLSLANQAQQAILRLF